MTGRVITAFCECVNASFYVWHVWQLRYFASTQARNKL